MGPQERVNFYYDQLRKDYQKSVAEAEIARQKARRPGDPADEEVERLFRVWASQETQKRLNDALARREKKGIDVNEGQTTVDLGLAGFFRIGQVHEDTMAVKTKREKVRKQRLSAAKAIFGRWPSVGRTIFATHQTIHGDPIDWELEITQDRIKHEEAAGNFGKAEEISAEGITKASQKIYDWLLENLPYQPEINASNINGVLIKIKETSGRERFEELGGFLKAKAVLEYRRGLVQKELGPLIDALNDISALQEVIPDNHRFATISWKSLMGSLFFKGKDVSLSQRFYCFKKAARNLLKTAKEDPKTVARSFLQMF